MPGANTRAMEKARTLACDTVIFDLEDAVSPDAKDQARQNVLDTLAGDGYGYREIVVRANGLDTPWGEADVEAFGATNISAMLFPKVEHKHQVTEIVDSVNAAGGGDLPIWLMIETPRGVLELLEFADHPRVEALVMGTSDLVKELHATHTVDRQNLAYSLQHCVLVARRLGKCILDGVHLDFADTGAFEEVCRNGREIGFDGKTLIHPSQIEAANRIFGFDDDAVLEARRVLDAWQTALAEGKGVAVLDGKLIENLHAAEAERVVAFAEALAQRSE